MSLSAFSLVIGVISYAFGFPLVFTDEAHMEWRRKMLKDENFLRIVGTAFIAIAATTLKYNWRITVDAEGIIILVAWLTLLKGLFVAWWPRKYSALRLKLEDRLFGTSGMQTFMGFLMVLFGALFTYFGLVLA